MQIAGNGSSSELLRWYQDRIGTELPRPWILTVPLLVYRIAMLAWALWLAQAMVGWLRWGWRCFSEGELWRPLRAGPAEAGS
jgi:cytoskeletal protein RodZ